MDNPIWRDIMDTYEEEPQDDGQPSGALLWCAGAMVVWIAAAVVAGLYHAYA